MSRSRNVQLGQEMSVKKCPNREMSGQEMSGQNLESREKGVKKCRSRKVESRFVRAPHSSGRDFGKFTSTLGFLIKVQVLINVQGGISA